ncbi:Hint domain-containing protein [Phaeobacter sp. C3_T13_0]|uniref:Hint domain-containing protein n=1 Tax=Phaeobacter cretensis TaxID=3342641 RepID=UPI0039BC96C5
MAWLAACSIIRKGITVATTRGSALLNMADDDLLTRGSLCLDLLLDEAKPSGTLLLLERSNLNSDGWPLSISLKRNLDRSITLTLCQPGCSLEHRVVAPHASTGEHDAARLVYSWDSLARWGRLALMTAAGANIATVDIPAPPPLRVKDAKALLDALPATADTCGLLSASINTDIVPVTSLGGLALPTKVATPEGPKSLGQLRRGDLVLTPEGESIPILHRIHRRVPAVGHDTPLRLRAPFFGLTEDLILAPQQRLVVSGTDVDYLFGRSDVRLTAAMLDGTALVAPSDSASSSELMRPHLLIDLAQLILPRHQRFIAAGTAVESLYLGRLRRDRKAYAVSALSHLDRHAMPEHAIDPAPLLRSFDAAVLAERRIA